MPRKARETTTAKKDVNSVTKAIDVLRAFIDGQEAWGVRELANALGQPGSSTHRVLQILRREGFVEWDVESQKYRTGMEFFRWWAILGRRLKVVEVAHPLMSELVAQIGEACWLGLYEAGEHRHAYISEVKSSLSPPFNAPIGKYEPLENSAGGLAVLAFLPDPDHRAASADGEGNGSETAGLAARLKTVRATGYAVVPSSEDDVPVMIGTPVVDAHGVPVGSLTVVAPRQRYQDAELEKIGVRVAEYAARLSSMIGSQMLGGAGIGTWRLGIDEIARLIQREIPGTGASMWTTGGERALNDLQNGRGAYCFAVAGSLRGAFLGEAPFNYAHSRLRAMFSLFPVFLHVIARRDMKIENINDLRGLRISAGEADYTTARVVLDLMRREGLVERGAAAAKRALVYLDYLEANREFAAGKLDAIVSLTGLGDPPYRKLARQVDLRLIPLEPALMETFIAHHPAYEMGVIPPGTYPGWERPTPTISGSTVMITTSDRSEEEVYTVTRAIYQHRGQLAATLQTLEVLNPEFLFRGIRVPLHPGAERFWREQGLLGGGAPGNGHGSATPEPRANNERRRAGHSA